MLYLRYVTGHGHQGIKMGLGLFCATDFWEDQMNSKETGSRRAERVLLFHNDVHEVWSNHELGIGGLQ